MELEQLLTNALFVVNHSGGKDSQALMLKIARVVPHSNILVVHAPLTEVEWPDTIEHIKETIPQGIAFREAPVASGKSLLDRVEERGKFPDPSRRWCTSDFKRGPIERTIRGYIKENPRFLGRIVNCMGMRRQESPARAKLEAWKFNERNSKAGRAWYDWLPILELTETEVFAAIAQAGQEPHWAYKAGMSRLSCCFCIMATKKDLTTAAKLMPDLYRRYVQLERKLEHTLSPSRRFLPDITGIAA